MPTSVRERAPLRLHHLIETPSGHRRRWGPDEPRAENVPSGEKFGDSIPGGFDQFDCQLPRRPHYAYQDLEPLSKVTTYGAGGVVAWQGRLERTPRVSGQEFSVAPNAVGYQAHLEDDNTASEVYVDRDLSHWTGPSQTRRATLLATWEMIGDVSVDPDVTTGLPALQLKATTPGSALDFICDAFYDAGAGNGIGSIYYDFTSYNTLSTYVGVLGAASDDIDTAFNSSSDLLTGTNSSGSGTFTPSPTTYRFGRAYMYTLAITPTATDHMFTLRRLAVFGNHGLTKRGTAPSDGFYASDIIADAVSRWAPLLSYTTGADGTIKPTTFVIPQAEFRDPTTVAEIVKAANRFHIRDWAVWEGPTFYYHDRGDRGREWRARVGPARLEETGPQVDRIWNGVIVFYRDVDGTPMTVGPTGSDANDTDDTLLDEDSENPANKAGIRKYAKLDMGVVSTPAGAIEVGARFLAESRQLDRSGKATLVGHVEDSKGILRPYWQVRAGDTIRFVDAADSSARRIVKTEKDVASRSCSVDLDAPPEGMDALLERLGVVLVEFGL